MEGGSSSTPGALPQQYSWFCLSGGLQKPPRAFATETEQISLFLQELHVKAFLGDFYLSPFSWEPVVCTPGTRVRKGGLLEKAPDCGKQRRIRPFPRDSREFRDFRDSRDSSSEKTPFVMTPFSGPEVPVVELSSSFS